MTRAATGFGERHIEGGRETHAKTSMAPRWRSFIGMPSSSSSTTSERGREGTQGRAPRLHRKILVFPNAVVARRQAHGNNDRCP